MSTHKKESGKSGVKKKANIHVAPPPASKPELRASEPKVLETLLATPFFAFADKMRQMFFVDYNQRCIYINDQFKRVTGVTDTDIKSPDFNFLNIYDEKSRPAVVSGFMRNLAGEEVDPMEAVLIAKDGRRLEVVITAKTIRMRGGIGILGIITDVSGVKLMEKELESEQQNIQLYMDAMAVLVVVLDSSGNVMAINRKTSDVLGYSEQEMAGKNWFDFMPSTSQEEGRSNFGRIMAGEDDGITNIERTMLCRSGQEKVVRWYITRVSDDRGKVVAVIGCGLDMAQEKVLENSLRDSEAKYRNLFQNSPLGIFRTTPDGRVLIANPALVKMLGYSSFEELAAKNVEKNGYHADTPRNLFIEKIERDGRVVGFESKWLKRDGSTMCARENAAAVKDSQGRTVYYEGTVEDTTRQKQSQEELYYRLNFERLIASISTRFVNIDARLVDQAMDHVLQEVGEFEGVDSCRINQFSKTGKQTVRTHGWRKSEGDAATEEKAKQTILLHPWTLKKLWRGEVVQLSRTSRLTQRKINAEAEYEYMERQGIQSLLCIPFRMYGQEKGTLVLADEHAARTWSPDTISLLRVICEIFSAALELKFTAMELEKERRLMNVLMDTIPDHIYFKDKQSRFIGVNKAWAEHCGVKNPEDAVGKTDFDVFTPEHAKQAFNDEQEVMRTGRPILAKEEKETWPDGTETWASTTKMPMYDEKGEVIGTFGISRDITARRRMEQERHELELKIQYAQKLESLSVLSGTIAHDFNNLLMGILGHTSLALMELNPESPAWESVKQIEATALCAAELTNQMLTYAGKSKVTLQLLNLASLVKEMSHLLEVSISKKVKLIYNFDDTGTMIEGDSAQIRQVVMNLIINASDAIGKKAGAIHVSTGVMPYDPACFAKCYIRVDEPMAESYAYVEVTDNGCGMDKATIGRMFEPFFTTKATGRGLGLAAIMGIVRSHKGGLCVESEVGKGTSFHILFPVSTRKVQASEYAAKADSRWSGSGTVLVVDDDEIVCKVTERILTKFGFTVVTSCSAETAAAAAKQHGGAIRAILLDISLPDLAGADVLNHMREAAGDVPIILMSGFNAEAATSDMTPGSFEGFLQKPFKGEALAGKLREVLEKKQ